MKQCNEVRDNLAAYVDDALTTEERAPIATHLAECPTCQQEATAQAALRKRLRALKRYDVAAPPLHIWNNAVRAWKHHDAMRRSRIHLRFALAGACILLLALGVVWARLRESHEFPVNAVLNDFRGFQKHPQTPQLVTTDPDKAARWLRVRIGSDLPPINLHLSRAELLGADALSLSHMQIGRLLYRGAHGVLAIYVVPKGPQFGSLKSQTFDDRSFFVYHAPKDVGMYGWSHDTDGYGLVLSQQPPQGADYALDAQRATNSPEH